MTKNTNESTLFPTNAATAPTGPVFCLGLTFPDDNTRREHFLAILREKLKAPKFRKIEGFPIGEDADILAMSDPPYYTAYPTPFLADLVREWSLGKKKDSSTLYSRNPLAIDVSEGKTDPLYKAHSYHTKVPYKAIVPAILHYTDPGDIILDGFRGSGMTGVAAQVCAHPDPDLKQAVEQARVSAGLPAPVWGPRHAVLNDLSPAATFIAANYCLPFRCRNVRQGLQADSRRGRKAIRVYVPDLENGEGASPSSGSEWIDCYGKSPCQNEGVRDSGCIRSSWR